MFNLGFGGQPGLPSMGAGLGFQGQFGGGFIQAPGAMPDGSGSVVFSATTVKAKPKDRSGRKEYVGDWKLSFPAGPEGFTPTHRERRYR